MITYTFNSQASVGRADGCGVVLLDIYIYMCVLVYVRNKYTMRKRKVLTINYLSEEYPFISITFRPTLTRIGSTCYDQLEQLTRERRIIIICYLKPYSCVQIIYII